MAYIDEMKGQEYIDKTRAYLDYLETHLNNVKRAFNELSEICKDMWWVTDDFTWHNLRHQVEWHDLSKFSKEEFTEYRECFFPVSSEESKPLTEAWEHHKDKNHHHHETVVDYSDLIHMIIDWTAMSYKFGDSAQAYYEKNKKKIRLTDSQVSILYEVFDRIHQYNTDVPSR